MDHESESDTNCNWSSWYSHQRIGGLGIRRMSKEHPHDSIVEISQNTEKNPGDLRKLAVTQTSVRNHRLTLVWKTPKGVTIIIIIYIFFLSRGIILWIELPWPESPANTYARHKVTLDNCFDLIRSHQQWIPWSLPLEIELTTTDCTTETLQLSHQFISHPKGTKSTIHGNCTAN